MPQLQRVIAGAVYLAVHWSVCVLAQEQGPAAGAWGTPDDFKRAVNRGWQFRPTTWNGSVLEEQHPLWV